MKKGSTHSEEAKEKMRQSKLGTTLTKAHKDNIRRAIKRSVADGTHFAPDSRGENNPFFGKKHTEETKQKLREKKKGLYALDKHPNWKGGKSFEEYPPEFSPALREHIAKKYHWRCQQCFRHEDELYLKGKKTKLDIHHIDYDKRNTEENNLIPLCRTCHLQTNFSREDWKAYFQNRV